MKSKALVMLSATRRGRPSTQNLDSTFSPYTNITRINVIIILFYNSFYLQLKNRIKIELTGIFFFVFCLLLGFLFSFF